MTEIIIDAFVDSIKLLPFLFLAYLLIEYFEHHASIKLEHALTKSGDFGPLVGGFLGMAPQCGFSVAATNFYSNKLITLGTLIAVYIGTSDETLPILFSRGESASTIFKVLGVKLLIAIPVGFLVDYIFKTRRLHMENTMEAIEDSCDKASCECEERNIFRASFEHTFKIFIYILSFTIILNLIVAIIGEETLYAFIASTSSFQPLFTTAIGMIPNCVSSIMLIQLMLDGVISFGSAMAGLVAGSGIALAVLFKVNSNYKDNFRILAILYVVGVSSGFILNMF